MKLPKVAGMYEIVPTVETLFCSSTIMTAFSSGSSELKTTLKPFRIPILPKRLRTAFAKVQL